MYLGHATAEPAPAGCDPASWRGRRFSLEPSACVALGPGNFDESVPVTARGAFLGPDLALGTTTTLALTSGGEVSLGPITGFIGDGASRDACIASTTPVTLTYTPPQTAAEQLTELRAATQGVGPGTSLADKVQEAQASLAAGNLAETCGTLDDFIHEVQGQAGKGVPAAQAPQLVATATHIQAVLGCG